MPMRWLVPANVVRETEAAFRRGRHEVFVLWTAGIDVTAQDLAITRCVVPLQEAGVGEFGGDFVRVDGDELARIAIENAQAKERSVVQLHTHPSTWVGMSPLDHKWEVLNFEGALSIIVPDYGLREFRSLDGVAVYEHMESDWRRLSLKEAKRRLRFVS